MPVKKPSLEEQLTMKTPPSPVETQEDEPWTKRQERQLKVLEEVFLRECDGLRAMGAAVDQRCIALAVTYVQMATMWAVRGVFQPSRLQESEMQDWMPARRSVGPTTEETEL